MTTKRVAKRKLTNFDFTADNAHLALVHKDQGGGANGATTLVMKSNGNYSQEFLQKASQVQVTLSFEEFLRKFFGLWYEDAKVLASILGMQDEPDEDENWYQDYIEEQVDKFQVLKSAYEAENKVEFLSKLSEDDYLTLLQNQEKIEKALDAIQSDDGGVEPTKPVTKVTTKTKKATKAVPQEDNNMSGSPEMIAKAQFDEIQKALDVQKVELQKALDEVKAYQVKEKEAVAKARKADLLAAVEVEDVAETLFKAVGELEAEQFDAVVEVVKALNAKVEKQGFFEEQGSAAEGQQDQNVSPVAKALRTRLTKTEQ